jgi:hypothetical protein
VQNVARVWMQSDSLAASEWIAQLPAGRERDAGAGILVHEIAEAAPDEAWQWAVSIGEASLRMRSAGQVLAPLAKHNPAEALRWIDQSGLPDQEKLTLRIQVNAGSAPSQIP